MDVLTHLAVPSASLDDEISKNAHLSQDLDHVIATSLLAGYGLSRLSPQSRRK